MKKLNAYISKQIIIGFLLVTFSLLSILWLTQSLRFLEIITNNGAPVSVFIKMTSCLMPRLFTIIAPIATFCAVLFVYNRMITDRELVVVKAAGISPFQSSKPAIYMGIILSIFALYVTNITVPKAENSFEDLQWQVKNEISHLMFREGEFTSIEPLLTIFISKHGADGSVEGIIINDERDATKEVTVSAKYGVIQNNGIVPTILLINGVRQEIDNNTNQFSSLSFDKYSVEFETSSDKTKKEEGVREKSLSELFNARDDNRLTFAEQNKYIIEGHKRLLSPWLNLVFALVACCGLLVGNFNRRGQTKIITIATICIVAIQSTDMALTNICIKNINLLFLIYMNIILPFIVCLFFLFSYNPSWITRLKNRFKEKSYEA